MRILLVDDEPIFLDEMKRIINEICEPLLDDPVHIEEAYSTEEALGAIEKIRPDCIFTDIQMTGKDGIELAKTASERWRDVDVIILSGYPTFSYAREAIQAQVKDYLVKPPSPDSVRELLLRVQEKYKLRLYQARQEYIRDLLSERRMTDKNGMPPDVDFPYRHYFGLVVHQLDAVPWRNHVYPLPADDGVQSYLTRIHGILFENGDAWIYRGEASYEWVVIFGLNDGSRSFTYRILAATLDHFTAGGSRIFIGHSGVCGSLPLLMERIPSMKQNLFASLSIGKSAVIHALESAQTPSNFEFFSAFTEKNLESCIHKKDWERFEKQIAELFRQWEDESFTCMALEQNLKRVARLFEDLQPGHDTIRSSALEKRIEEIVYIASDFHELKEAFLQMLDDHFRLSRPKDVSSREDKFKEIERYIRENLHETLTLTSIVEHFVISRTYLSNLFRQFTRKSFVTYVTELRVERAQELIAGDPERLVKDVAPLVGYEDYYYFSRVFKSIAGESPSEYKERVGNHKPNS